VHCMLHFDGHSHSFISALLSGSFFPIVHLMREIGVAGLL